MGSRSVYAQAWVDGVTGLATGGLTVSERPVALAYQSRLLQGLPVSEQEQPAVKEALPGASGTGDTGDRSGRPASGVRGTAGAA